METFRYYALTVMGLHGSDPYAITEENLALIANAGTTPRRITAQLRARIDQFRAILESGRNLMFGVAIAMPISPEEYARRMGHRA